MHRLPIGHTDLSSFGWQSIQDVIEIQNHGDSNRNQYYVSPSSNGNLKIRSVCIDMLTVMESYGKKRQI